MSAVLQSYKEQQSDVEKMGLTISSQERIIAAIELQMDNLQDERQLERDSHNDEVCCVSISFPNHRLLSIHCFNCCLLTQPLMTPVFSRLKSWFSC